MATPESLGAWGEVVPRCLVQGTQETERVEGSRKLVSLDARSPRCRRASGGQVTCRWLGSRPQKGLWGRQKRLSARFMLGADLKFFPCKSTGLFQG